MQSRKSENQSSKEVKPASKDHMWPPKSFLKPTIRNESWTHATAERETIRIRRDECPAVIRFTKRRMLTTCWIVSGLFKFRWLSPVKKNFKQFQFEETTRWQANRHTHLRMLHLCIGATPTRSKHDVVCEDWWYSAREIPSAWSWLPSKFVPELRWWCLGGSCLQRQKRSNTSPRMYTYMGSELHERWASPFIMFAKQMWWGPGNDGRKRKVVNFKERNTCFFFDCAQDYPAMTLSNSLQTP